MSIAIRRQDEYIIDGVCICKNNYDVSQRRTKLVLDEESYEEKG